MTNTTPLTKISPFQRILVPYDGSEPADTALEYAVALGRAGAKVDLVHVVDEAAAIASSAGGMVVIDPTPLLDALNEQGRTLLHAAQERCRTLGVEPATAVVHDRPATALVAFAERNGDELIVMGTHGRSGLSHMFLGSTTEGVLHGGTIPVLAVRSAMHVGNGPLFRNLLVAVDDSDPANAAAELGGSLARATGATCTFCHTIDTEQIYAKASVYGYEAQPYVETLKSLGAEILVHAQTAARFAKGESYGTVVEDSPAHGIIATARSVHADAIVIGSHGRRGLNRFFLGSVAEQIVRVSPVPVLVVRSFPQGSQARNGAVANEPQVTLSPIGASNS